MKHAGPATATVRLSYDKTAVRIEIADTGRGMTAGLNGTATGHGLVGMRERAASVGGALDAGPGQLGGFLVTARLPADGWQPTVTPGAQAANAVAEGAADGSVAGLAPGAAKGATS